MYLQKNTEICVLNAISPVHAGAGSATGAVDLPIQRERHTGWPHIQASGVKGAFRDHCERVWMLRGVEENNLVGKDDKKQALELAKRIFGRSDGNTSQAGAMAFSDAKLLAFPVRSNLAPFVWVVCPALIKRLARDLELAGIENELTEMDDIEENSFILLKGKMDKEIILEDISLVPQDGKNDTGLVGIFDKLAPAIDRLVMVPDQHFSFLMETATEVQAQIKIEAESGTTATGSLRYQELLPTDAVLYTVVFWGDERAEDTNMLVLDTLRKAVKEAAARHIQMGGDLTLGRGIFTIDWFGGEK